MSIKKAESGWLVDLQPGGRGGKRFRKTLDTKGEALAYEAWLKNKVREEPAWAPAQKDRRRLSDLVKVWFESHGSQLRNGKAARQKLDRVCEAMGNPKVSEFKPACFADYRSRRLEAGTAPATVNREHAYLRAVFNELKRMGQWLGSNPLESVRQFKVSERELSFLTLDQIRVLLKALESHGPDVVLVTRICLATGARWSEAEGLRPSQVRGGMVNFTDTKSGKNRSVPISEELEKALQAHLVERYGKDGAVMASRFFYACMERFRTGMEKSGLLLPKGQLTHVLRHSFASHFMMNGGNILVLQKILGHSSLAMTMRYAHLAPDHLQEARRLNPLAALTVG